MHPIRRYTDPRQPGRALLSAIEQPMHIAARNSPIAR